MELGQRPWMLEQFQRTWELQEQRKRVVAERRREVEEWVGLVERATWDKEGAVEDMGGKV